MNFLYNTGIHLYSIGARIASRTNPKAKKMTEGQKSTFGHLRATLPADGRTIWIHASSLGEFEQGRPLIERLRRLHPDRKILLTFFSPSGYEVRKNYPMADAVAYLPFDTPRNARRFIETVRPSVAIFIKYEFWGNYLQQLHKAAVPVYIISAIFRQGQIFFRPWGGMFRRMLRRFDRIYLQDNESQKLLSGIGIDNTVVAGDTRFDRVTDVMAQTFDIAGGENLRSFIIFGSSWGADEANYIPWLNANRDVKFIIAPHEFDEARVAALCNAIDGNVIPLSQWERHIADNGTPPEHIRGIIVDCFGKLSSLYRYASVAYIGGGHGAGIHNINEAAVYGIPVVFGPNYHKFKEARDLISLGGAFCVENAAATSSTLDRLLSDEACRTSAGKTAGRYIADNIGATDRIFSDIFGEK
ncbi:3-deoxy-D-manno-octulosonic acid transferase [Muribaculaceae bacterium Isolate-002 (NCI)]|nr:3-deoxy-D-manno-octulosonic acid transferase [Muribaculaceae bacterium Isolate-002 (NCI)]